jgi:MPBQ/MSBQ methyltransferase
MGDFGLPLSADPDLFGDAGPAMNIGVGEMARRLFARALNPVHLFKAASLHWQARSQHDDLVDAHLALFNKILPSDFLHYGYFDELECKPEDMKLSDIQRAQVRYAELLLDLIDNKTDPVLDVGCGMGGLSRMLRARGLSPTALTPDRLQAIHLAGTQPEVPLLQCKLEAMPVAQHKARFGTVLTSESLQYLKLDGTLPVIEAILKPGGRWIASDYFQRHPCDDDSCHNWEIFQELLPKHGWRITQERDISKNVVPMLSYINMWVERVLEPLMELTTLHLRRNRPVLHYLLEGVIDHVDEAVQDNMKRVDPAWFMRHRRYMMLVIERA